MSDEVGEVEAAVHRALEGLPGGLQGSAEAATAVALAREVDRGRVMSVAPVAKELRATLEWLRAEARAAAEVQVVSAVDSLADRFAARRARAAEGNAGA